MAIYERTYTGSFLAGPAETQRHRAESAKLERGEGSIGRHPGKVNFEQKSEGEETPNWQRGGRGRV